MQKYKQEAKLRKHLLSLVSFSPWNEVPPLPPDDRMNQHRSSRVAFLLKESWARGPCHFMAPGGGRSMKEKGSEWKSTESEQRKYRQGAPMRRPPNGGTRARNAATHEYMASQGSLSPWLQLPWEAAMHWLHTQAGVGRAVFPWELCQVKPL